MSGNLKTHTLSSVAEWKSSSDSPSDESDSSESSSPDRMHVSLIAVSRSLSALRVAVELGITSVVSSFAAKFGTAS